MTRQKNTEKFLAAIANGGKSFHLGTFDSEIDAAIAYNEAAKQHFGESANLNKIDYVLAPALQPLPIFATQYLESYTGQ